MKLKAMRNTKQMRIKVLIAVMLTTIFSSQSMAANNSVEVLQNWFNNNPYRTNQNTNYSLPKTVSTATNKYSVPSVQNQAIGKPNLLCVINAAHSQNVPVDLLLGIQSVERGATGQRVYNKNTTYDIGAFQINSIHLRRVASMGGSEYDLSNRGCFNAIVAATLLKEALYHPSKQNKDFYTRASGYHSWNSPYNGIYRAKLIKYTKQWQAWLSENGMGYLVTSPRL